MSLFPLKGAASLSIACFLILIFLSNLADGAIKRGNLININFLLYKQSFKAIVTYHYNMNDSIYFFFVLGGHPCPEQYQFAFNNGDSCCTDQEEENVDLITDKSTSCIDKKSISCPRRPCVDNYGSFF